MNNTFTLFHTIHTCNRQTLDLIIKFPGQIHKNFIHIYKYFEKIK